MNKAGKTRLDQLLVERGLAETREKARRVIMAGLVRVRGLRADKPGLAIPLDAPVEIAGPQNPYVSRGGLKLAKALKEFDLTVDETTLALDIGASTGGFTDCLLQHGCGRVIAVDTGRGQIHERIRRDPRVELLENTNARNLTPDLIGGRRPTLAVIDVSFISLRLVLPAVMATLAPGGRCAALVKPQFEAGRGQVGAGGIVRDPAVHEAVLRGMCGFCEQSGWFVAGLIPSPIPGGEGNIEFLMLIEKTARSEPCAPPDLASVLEKAGQTQSDEPVA